MIVWVADNRIKSLSLYTLIWNGIHCITAAINGLLIYLILFGSSLCELKWVYLTLKNYLPLDNANKLLWRCDNGVLKICRVLFKRIIESDSIACWMFCAKKFDRKECFWIKFTSLMSDYVKTSHFVSKCSNNRWNQWNPDVEMTSSKLELYIIHEILSWQHQYWISIMKY